jgi:branched-chain amino acid transport system ATP-binding protein
MLELRGLSGGYDELVVVHDLSLTIPNGKVTALLGPNGAGKTTTLRLIMGLLKPQSGEVWFEGQDLTGMSPQKRANLGICYIPEGRAIFPSLSVRDNLIVQTPANDVDGFERVVSAFPVLGARLAQRAGTLSGGEQRMLGLARAYLQNPRLILVDEPSLGLAPIIIHKIFDTLRELAATGVSLLVVEQYAQKAMALADEVYVMAKGRIQGSGTPAEMGSHLDLLGTYYAGS